MVCMAAMSASQYHLAVNRRDRRSLLDDGIKLPLTHASAKCQFSAAC